MFRSLWLTRDVFPRHFPARDCNSFATAFPSRPSDYNSRDDSRSASESCSTRTYYHLIYALHDLSRSIAIPKWSSYAQKRKRGRKRKIERFRSRLVFHVFSLVGKKIETRLEDHVPHLGRSSSKRTLATVPPSKSSHVISGGAAINPSAILRGPPFLLRLSFCPFFLIAFCAASGAPCCPPPPDLRNQIRGVVKLSSQQQWEKKDIIDKFRDIFRRSINYQFLMFTYAFLVIYIYFWKLSKLKRYDPRIDVQLSARQSTPVINWTLEEENINLLGFLDRWKLRPIHSY